MRQDTRPLQVLLRAKPDATLVAGLPCAVRTAFRAGQELAPERVILAGADAKFCKRWAFPLNNSGAAVFGGEGEGGALKRDQPVLVVDADVFPDEGALKELAQAGAGRRVVQGRTAAVLLEDAKSLGPGSLEEIHARGLAAGAAESREGKFFDASTADGIKAAEAALFSRLAKDNDGYIARLDRRLSLAITRLLLPLPVTPNQVTTISLVFSLWGAWQLAAASAPRQLAGALILWFCCLLDGCDGEIARLKHHGTPWGARFDVWADHVAHLATFVALPIGVARLHPGTHWLVPGALLVSGFLASGFMVWKLVLSAPEQNRGALWLHIERIASRDYIYLIVAFAALGRLDWFVWSAAIGSHVFWLWLCVQASVQAPGAAHG